MPSFLPNKNFEKFKKVPNFLTKFDVFKYLVIVFDFCNSSVSRQNFINNNLFNFLYHFVQAHFNNIVIYNKALQYTCFHICKVFQRLQEIKM